MIYIAHRGNLNGPNPDKENHPDYIKEALSKGFNVEIDVWLIDNKFVLGHDKPDYETDWFFLNHTGLWCHAKNMEALDALLDPCITSFFHDVDECVLTSNCWIWTFPGKKIFSCNQIAVMPERIPNWDIKSAGGICSDFVIDYRQKFGA